MKTSVVLGGAGFLGSHLVDALLQNGETVIAVDDLSSGKLENISGALTHHRFRFRQQDIREPLMLGTKIDTIFNLASPASPKDYMARPIETLMTGSRGSENALQAALEHGARYVYASTSEVYGDPLVHPQAEDYLGNVNPVGPRSCYDEAKRFGEAITMAFIGKHELNGGIIRIFNTYGPRLREDDGRVVSTLITQALIGEPMTIFGSGSQTRSFCYVDDLIDGIIRFANSGLHGPMNLGNPAEYTMVQLAELVAETVEVELNLVFKELPRDDPQRRRPDISYAIDQLDWIPATDLKAGIQRTVNWFRESVKTCRN